MNTFFFSPGFLWPLLTIACLAIILYGLYKALNKTDFTSQKKQRILMGTTLIMICWVWLIMLLANKGFFADLSQLPPRPAIGIWVPLPFVLFISFSKSGSQLLKSIPAHWLIFMQSFRIIVELLLWMAFLQNMLPVQMSFEGGNLDILTGLLAIVAGYTVWKKMANSHTIILAFNIAGILLLLNILVIAILSMPTPIRYFMNEPSNTIVGKFPYILLPTVLVPIAYSFHIFSFRQLALLRKKE